MDILDFLASKIMIWDLNLVRYKQNICYCFYINYWVFSFVFYITFISKDSTSIKVLDNP